MPQKVTCNMCVQDWHEERVKGSDAMDSKFSVVTDNRHYSGDMVGTGPACYTMVYYGKNRNPKEGAPCTMDTDQCAFAGQQHFEGTMLGKKGAFALNMKGTYDCGVITAVWEIVPETTTGEFEGATGHGAFNAKFENGKFIHTGELNVEL